jgi:hypothetical protein
MSEIATWSGTGLGFQIDYSRQTLEGIRRPALQGLMDLPRIGMGLGGILLGEREELAQARDRIAGTDASRVIGWYCSKGLRPLELTDSDQTVLAGLFPETWHIGLLVQPHRVRPASIAFFALDSSGELLKGEPGELAEWREQRAEVVPTEEPEPAPAAALPVIGQTNVPALNSEWIGQKAKSGDPFSDLAMDAARREGSRRKRLTWILAACTVVVPGLIGLILSRYWTEPARPSLVLHSTDAGGALLSHWNNEAVNGVDHTEIFIDDGGRVRAVPLDRSQLSAGELRYVRTPSRVTVAMTAGNLQAETSFDAPAPTRRKNPGTSQAP